MDLDLYEKFATKLKCIKNPQQLTSFFVNVNKNLLTANKKRRQIKFNQLLFQEEDEVNKRFRKGFI